jgi:uncharacterized protein CbrC (UPF0167 family)
MSYLSDKLPCSQCGDLYDLDQLNWDNVCRWCVIDQSFMADVFEDWESDEPENSH